MTERVGAHIIVTREEAERFRAIGELRDLIDIKMTNVRNSLLACGAEEGLWTNEEFQDMPRMK